jgi:hypothetical protein
VEAVTNFCLWRPAIVIAGPVSGFGINISAFADVEEVNRGFLSELGNPTAKGFYKTKI